MPEKAKRRLYDVEVNFISLVGKGANKKSIIWKSADGGEQLKEVPILKVDDDKRLVYGIVYAPDEVDTQGDTMTAGEIEKASQDFMKNARTTQIDKNHNEEANQGFVAESWIVKDGDAVFGDQPVGSWAVSIKVEDDATWALVKSGDIGGISMGGFSRVEELEKGDGPIRNFFKKLFGGTVEKDFTASYKSRMVNEAIWALNESLMDVMRDDNISEKQAALIQSASQFIQFINSEFDTMSKQQSPETPANKQQEPGGDAVLVQKFADLETLVKSQGELIEKQNATIEAQAETIKGLQGRVDALEKAHPGSQAARVQDNQNGVVEKNFKGIRII